MTPELRRALDEAFAAHPPAKVGVAVSGGSDSLALLHLLHRYFRDSDTTLHAVTVDHGLRPEAADEAREVARICAALDVPHDILEWRGWDGTGNLQNAARVARFDLISDWARQRDISMVCLGHTADDQAETVLMRLARRAGVNGLAAMARRTRRQGVDWLRPLLGVSRETLRDFLRGEGITWIEDPSNDDPRYTRIKARRALTALAPMGIDAAALAEVAENMQESRTALNWQAFMAARLAVKITAGAVAIDERQLRVLPTEITRRLLVHSLMWINNEDYVPRRAAVTGMLQAIRENRASTLQGCQMRRVRGRVWIFREFNAVAHTEGPADEIWDRRWRLAAPETAVGDEVIRALGPEGLPRCPAWRETGIPRDVLLSSPAVWRGETLVAAPLAGWAENWQAEVIDGADGYFAALLSH